MLPTYGITVLDQRSMSTLPPVTFLLVDDRPANLLALEALLTREELVLLKANSGEEALELLLCHDVALALLDVQMPDMDGFELAELMRGSERTRHVPIIFVTAGKADKHRRFRGYETGAVDFITKPVEPDILRSKTNVFFELHRQRQEIAAHRDQAAAAAEALRHADARKDRFLAVLAHELRNPVAALAAGMDMLDRRPPEQSAEIRARMKGTIGHLARLVEDLLDVSRVSEGKISLQIERTELSDVLRSAVDVSRHAIDAAGHHFESEMPAEPVWLNADHARLAQVVANLLTNAAKYTKPGGMISLCAERTGGSVQVRVRDDGVGIPVERQADIFDIFTQVSDHEGLAGGGLGIGLALVKQLVAMHGGTIAVASEGAGTGATFTVLLPAAD